MWNLPNLITLLRLFLSLILFVVLHARRDASAWPLFLVVAATDWMDGYLARRLQKVTQLGRIMDPFADKILIAGTYIFLAARPGSEILPWMVVVIVGREMLVTVLRSYLEEQGHDFSANMPGKVKMVLQCAAALGSIWLCQSLSSTASSPAWLVPSVRTLVWATLAITVYSGAIYVLAAIRLLRK